MIRGMYSSATGMISQYQKINIMGNNLSNIDTTGFKRDEMTLRSFADEITDRMSEGAQIGSLSTGVAVNGVTTDYTQGSPEQTFRNGDLAIVGNGFFAVQDATGGVKYTRNGSFVVDAGGYLALPSGERLLGANGGPLEVGGDSFTVATDGTVSAGGRAVGTVALYQPQNGVIAKRTDGFFDITTPAAAGGSIRQGFLEGSNVDAVTEMTGMMEATRTFQSCQQSFQVGDETLDKLISSVGSIRA